MFDGKHRFGVDYVVLASIVSTSPSIGRNPELNHYLAEDAKKSVRQVVLEIPSGKERTTKFGQILFGARFMELMEQSWLTGFFQLDGDPGPYLLVRADGATAKLRGCALRVAFSFFRMRTSGLFVVYVTVDSPTAKTPEYPHVVFEMAYGLDAPHTTQLIRDAIDGDLLHICVAEGQGNLKRVFNKIRASRGGGP